VTALDVLLVAAGVAGGLWLHGFRERCFERLRKRLDKWRRDRDPVGTGYMLNAMKRRNDRENREDVFAALKRWARGARAVALAETYREGAR
jgi:hypothetical protein